MLKVNASEKVRLVFERGGISLCNTSLNDEKDEFSYLGMIINKDGN